MLESSSRQEINEKQVRLTNELKKIGILIMVECLRATTLITPDNTTLSVFYSLYDEEWEACVKLFLSGEFK